MKQWARSLGSFSFVIFLTAASLIVAGCEANLFEGLGGSGGDDVEVLLADARTALANGDAEEAVEYLKSAHASDPDHSEVRIELVRARFEANDIDLISLQSVGNFLINGDNSKQSGRTPDQPLCTFDAGATSSSVIDFSQSDAYQQLSALIEVFEDASELLNALGASDRSELSTELEARLLLLRAFTRSFQVIDEVHEAALERSVELHRLSDGSIGLCAEETEDLEQASGTVSEMQHLLQCDLLVQFEQALDDLRARNQLLGDTDQDVILNVMEDVLTALDDQLDANCEDEI